MPRFDDLPNCRLLALETRYQSMEYTVFINGRQVSSVGRVSSSMEIAEPEYRPHVSSFSVCNNELDMVIQISSYHHRKGGLESPLRLGLADQIQTSWESRQILDVFLFGGVIIMALYHLGLYVLRRENKIALYFAVFCFSIGIRVIVVGQYLILTLIPGIPWGILLRIEYISFSFPLIAASLFLNSLFPDEFPRWLLQLNIIVSGAVCLATAGPVSFFTHLTTPFQLFLLTSIVLIAIVILKAVMRKREGSVLFFLSMAAVFFTEKPLLSSISLK